MNMAANIKKFSNFCVAQSKDNMSQVCKNVTKFVKGVTRKLFYISFKIT